MIQKDIRLYTEFISLIVSIEFPSQKIGYRFRLLEQIFFSQSTSKIIEILNKHNLTVLSNTFNYFIRINEINEVDYDNKLRIFEEAFGIYLSVEGIGGFETAPLPIRSTCKIENRDILKDTQFLSVPSISSTGVKNTKQKKYKKNSKGKNKVKDKRIKRSWEKNIGNNVYGIRARIIYTGMKN